MDRNVQPALENMFAELRQKVPEVRAIFLLTTAGKLTARAAADPHSKTDALIAEYATFLRIAQRTFEDMGMGDVNEHLHVSGSGVIVVRRINTDHFAVVFCSAVEQLGRLRYELRRSLLYSSLCHL